MSVGTQAAVGPAKGLTARKLAKFLSDGLGLPCALDDVNNARRKKTFTPHQVPRTQEAVLMLNKAQRALLPYLKIDELLTSKAEFTLGVDPL
jgi:hypothetical protein